MPATLPVPPAALLVDDEPYMRLMLASLLRGYVPADTIASAVDGFDALQYLDAYPIPLLITDNQMPNLTGLELIDIVKARHPNTCVILISGDVHNDIERRGYEHGADYVLIKPFRMVQLRAILEQVLIPALPERVVAYSSL